MKFVRRIALLLTALALLASQPARADVYGYIDENGLAHFAAERIDDRYVLFMKGAAVAGGQEGSAIAQPRARAAQAKATLLWLLRSPSSP